jgi:hypothetical protein
MAITVAPLTTAVMGSVSAHRAGIASGINNAVSRAAGVLALAVFGALALSAFGAALETRTGQLDLPSAARAAIHAQAANLGNAHAPAGLTAESSSAVEQAIKLAFVDTFRLLAGIAAGMAWLSALLAALTVESRMGVPVGETSEGQQ